VAHVGNTATLAVGGVGEDCDCSAGGGDEAGDDAEEGGLAGAVFAEDDGRASGGEIGGHVTQSGEGAVDAGDRVQSCGGGCFGTGWGYGGHLMDAIEYLHASIGLTLGRMQRVRWMRRANILKRTAVFLSAGLLVAGLQAQQASHLDDASRKLSRDVFQQLIEINTTDSVGSTTVAAEAMRKRLIDAGFPAEDVVVLGPNSRKGNMVARYRGKEGSGKKPVLIIGHIDVVEAKREDWTTDPFVFTEKDGYFYGRGTQDMKESDAAVVTSFIRLKREGFVPDRDIILALTADEEGGKSNGVDWLLKNHRELVDAGFALNADAGGLSTEKGRPLNLGVEATEKLYADFRLTATNPGGHSSLPKKDNAIYHLADALGRLERYSFPFELNAVTRGYFEAMSKIETGELAADMRGVLKAPPDKAAVARLSEEPLYNSTMRTTCVATMVQAGHAHNALPQRAEANVNCRILPGHTPAEVRAELIRVIADPKVEVKLVNDAGALSDRNENDVSVTPPPLNEEVFTALHRVTGQMWPGLSIVPEMETGASDSKITMSAGIPSYGFSGMGIDGDDVRAHGKDERIGVESFYTGVDFDYRYLKTLTGGGK
jgi:acetylornithine deacetylase/succinyl-diaminopimelate desuccinylase-like protein